MLQAIHADLEIMAQLRLGRFFVSFFFAREKAGTIPPNNASGKTHIRNEGNGCANRRARPYDA